MRKFLDKVYNTIGDKQEDLKTSLTDRDSRAGKEPASRVCRWLHRCSTVRPRLRSKDMLELAGSMHQRPDNPVRRSTGEEFERQVTVGYMYMLKLNHSGG